jgi:GTP 3',8-cyclase
MLRSYDDAELIRVIGNAIHDKPRGHDFVVDRNSASPALSRHMSVTGG